MTQTSRPAADHLTNFPTSDAGPYSADQWAELFKALFSPDDADQGPLIRYLNELEVSLNAAGPPPVFRVATGASMVNGHFHESDANVDFTIPQPAANPRIDRVVVLVNNTNALVTVSDLGFTLDFPDVLTDYNGTASVEPYSARLVIVQGTEAGAPVAPGLDQNINHYMIPLYQYQISVAGAITGGTDQREFCLFASSAGVRKFWVPAITGYNVTDGTEIAAQSYKNAASDPSGPLLIFPDTKECDAVGRFRVPYDFYRNMSVTGVLLGGNGGDIYAINQCYHAQCTEDFQTTSSTTGSGAEATEANVDDYTCHRTLDFGAALNIDDICQMTFTRRGDNVLDTVNAAMYFLGWWVEYEAKS